jgi:hypothetical protein
MDMMCVIGILHEAQKDTYPPDALGRESEEQNCGATH